MEMELDMRVWGPQKTILIALSDETAEERTPEDLKKFLRDLRNVCGEYGFDFSSWGSERSMKGFLDEKYKDIKVRLRVGE